MVRAEELIKQQYERRKIKHKTFKKILELVEKKIQMSNNCNNYYTWYEIPELLLGLPIYSIKECKKYLIKKLKKNGFKIETYEPNLILILWFPLKQK